MITPPVLDDKVQELGPSFAIAVGEAIGGLK